MRHVLIILFIALASWATGLLTGALWIFGNKCAAVSTLRLVLGAIPANLIVAAIFYYLLRGSVALVSGGITLLVLFLAINLLVTVAVSVSYAASINAGKIAGIGAHVFSWGLSYAFGQAFHDVRHHTWLHED